MLPLDRLEEIETRCLGLTEQLGRPEVIADNQQYQKAAKALSELTPIVEKYRLWKKLEKGERARSRGTEVRLLARAHRNAAVE